MRDFFVMPFRLKRCSASVNVRIQTINKMNLFQAKIVKKSDSQRPNLEWRLFKKATFLNKATSNYYAVVLHGLKSNRL